MVLHPPSRLFFPLPPSPPPPPAPPLPRCSDPDDQLFLVLADAARADYLLTRDKALLKLGRARYGLPFRIAQPEAIVLLP